MSFTQIAVQLGTLSTSGSPLLSDLFQLLPQTLQLLPQAQGPGAGVGREGLTAIANPVFLLPTYLPTVFPWEHTCIQVYTQPAAAIHSTPTGSHI